MNKISTSADLNAFGQLPAGASRSGGFIPDRPRTLPHGDGAGGSHGLPAPQVGLTQRQMDCLRFVQGHIEAFGYSPALHEIKWALGLSANSGIFRLLSCLEERGYIRRLPNRARAIEILRPVSLPHIGAVPLYAVKVPESHNPLIPK